MVNSLIGIIGVRAEVIGVRQYLADGRNIKRINEQIAESTKKVQAASLAEISASTAAGIANKRTIADKQLLIKAINDEVKAEQKLALTRNTNVAGQRNPATGRFISAQPVQANIDQAAKELAFRKSLTAFISKGVAQSTKESTVAGKAEAIQIANTNRLLEQQAAIEARLATAKRSRLNAATTVTALAGAAVIGVTAGASISAAAKYETVLAKINGLTSATTEQTKELGAALLKQSQEIPVSAIDQANAAYVALSSGIKDTTQALEIATLSSKAQVAQMGDAKDVARVITAVLNSYGKENIDAATTGDILTKAIQEGSAEASDFVGNIGRLVGIAPKLNVKFSELSAIVAYLTNTGLTAAEATTALLGILNETAQASPGQAEALAKVGLTFEQFRVNIRDKGLIQALVDLNKLVEQQGGDLKEIFPAIRAYNGLLSIISNNGENVKKVLGETQHAVGALGEAFDVNKNTLANTAQLLKNQLNIVLIEIGNKVIPKVVKGLKDFSKIIQENQQDISNFIAVGLVAIVNILKDFVVGLIEIIKGLQSVNKAFETITGSGPGAAVAVAAVGVALAWALPGGSILKGLLLAVELIGILSGPTGDRAAQKLNDFFGLGQKSKSTINPEDFRVDIKRTGSIESAIRDRFGDKGFSGEIATELIKKWKSEGIDTTKGIDEFNRAIKETDKQFLDMAGNTSKAANAEKDLNAQIPKTTTESDKLKKELQSLAQGFQKSSEVAGQVESITVAFKKFGTINKELADAFGLSASQAGQVQGFDAIIRAREREQNEIFNNIEAIAAITQAWRLNATVGKQLALELAQASLTASQTALGNVFNQPTQQVANLNVGLAQQKLNTARIQQSNNPQIQALNQQLAAINKQIAAANRANTRANREATQRQKAQQDAQRKAQEAAQRAAQAAADAFRMAQLQAQIAAERQLAALQKLIDANNKAASNLQEAFLKSNEALQVQINTAIGKGDSATALTLVDQQRAATKEYRNQQTALQKSNQSLTTQQKVAQEAEEERQRQAQLAAAAFEVTQKQTTAQEDLTTSIDETKEAQEEQTQALEDSKQAIQDQIDALQGPIDASQQQEKTIQDSIAVFEAQTNVLKALGVAADKTLLTQEQQRQAAQHFTEQISFASSQAQILAQSFYDFIPGAKEADLIFQTLNKTMDSVNNKVNDVLNPAFDYVAAHANLLATAEGNAAASMNTASRAIIQSAINLEREILAHTAANEAYQNHAQGGIFTKPTLGWIGEAGPEAILPLSNPYRSREIISQISPTIMASIMNKNTGQSIFAPNITVTGATLDTMEATAIKAVQSAFRDARIMSGRTGGLITTGLGPNH